MRYQSLWALAVSVSICGYLSGCADTDSKPMAESTTEMDHDHEGHDHDHEVDVEAVLASLTPHEQQIAKAQDMKCIVAGEPLGSMGKPMLIKDVKGHDFLICCKGCEEELRSDPDKYIAKLGDKADQTATEAPADAS